MADPAMARRPGDLSRLTPFGSPLQGRLQSMTIRLPLRRPAGHHPAIRPSVVHQSWMPVTGPMGPGVRSRSWDSGRAHQSIRRERETAYGIWDN